MSTKISVVGAGGRMGQAILNLLKADGDNWQIVGAVDMKPAAGYEDKHISKADAVKESDVLIDFSSLESSLETAELCAEAGSALVVGTTGFNPEQRAKLLAAGQKTKILWAPNMSLGVNLLFKLTGQVAGILGDQYNIEIIEAHHNQKVDAPSGTATRLKEEALGGRGLKEENAVYGRKGIVGKRPSDEIAVHTVRGGSIVGEHTVLFAGPGEQIELKHTAISRDTFASGAIQGAAYLVKEAKGPGVYSMADLLPI